MKVQKKYSVKIKINEIEKNNITSILTKSINAISDHKLLLPLLSKEEIETASQLIKLIKNE